MNEIAEILLEPSFPELFRSPQTMKKSFYFYGHQKHIDEYVREASEQSAIPIKKIDLSEKKYLLGEKITELKTLLQEERSNTLIYLQNYPEEKESLNYQDIIKHATNIH